MHTHKKVVMSKFLGEVFSIVFAEVKLIPRERYLKGNLYSNLFREKLATVYLLSKYVNCNDPEQKGVNNYN